MRLCKTWIKKRARIPCSTQHSGRSVAFTEVHGILTVFTAHSRGRTNRLEMIWPSVVNFCRTVAIVDFFVPTAKSSWKNRLSSKTNIRRFVRRKFVCPVCTSDDLSVQTICSSPSVKTAIENKFKNLRTRRTIWIWTKLRN